MTSLLRVVLLFVGLLPAVTAAWAVQPDEILDDPVLESRARAISAQLRCLVCQNETIDESNAPLARDLRLLVRERLSAGDSDAAVVDFVVARYGEFVLLRPRFGPHTLVLWLAPVLLLLAGLALAWRVCRRRGAEGGIAAQALSPEEQRRLERLLEE